MRIKYKISQDLLNNLYNFAENYGKVYALMPLIDQSLIDEVSSVSKKRAALGAVLKEKEIFSKFNSPAKFRQVDRYLAKNDITSYRYYLGLLDNLASVFSDYQGINERQIQIIHAKLVELKDNYNDTFRTENRVLQKEVFEEGQYKTVDLVVKTSPDEISEKVSDFIDWIKTSGKENNPIITAAIAHFRIAQVHPYIDGNGRLSRIFARGILLVNGIDPEQLLSIDDYYLEYQHEYFDVIEEAIETGDLSKWLEFYAQGLLDSIEKTIALFFEISGGTIDINNNKILQLGEAENAIVKVLLEQDQASGAEIARKLSVSRQSVNILLRKMFSKGIVTKIGKSTSARYKLSYLDVS